MGTLKTRLYRRALGRASAPPPSARVGWLDLLYYLWKRGGTAWLRGSLRRIHLGCCGGRLLVGKRVTLLFARQLSVGHNVYIGNDTMINALSHEGFRFGDHVRIREHVWMQATSTLDHLGKGLVIGDDTYVGPRCMIGAGGGVTLGSHVTLGAGVQLLAENHEFRDRDALISTQGVTRRGIVVEGDVWIGNAVIILDGVRIGEGAVIGAGAVVTKDIPPYSIVVGNPSRVIGMRTSRQVASATARC